MRAEDLTPEAIDQRLDVALEKAGQALRPYLRAAFVIAAGSAVAMVAYEDARKRMRARQRQQRKLTG